MFVETTNSAEANGCVDARILLETPEGGQDIQLAALVVHRVGKGFGLMFRDPDAPAGQTLDTLLF